MNQLTTPTYKISTTWKIPHNEIDEIDDSLVELITKEIRLEQDRHTYGELRSAAEIREAELRERNPDLKRAWEEYQVMLRLVAGQEPDVNT